MTRAGKTFVLSAIFAFFWSVAGFANPPEGRPFQELQRQIDDLGLSATTTYTQCAAPAGLSGCEALCPTGTVLSGGGIGIGQPDPGGLQVSFAAPSAPEDNKFRCVVRNENAGDWFFFCYATCLTLQ